ncbi:hypothetical protein HK105_203427 [Polyrhizophydium stewartii]|uniref:Uncharacterized protein n=1 Tax=Polyrhizophydium stewartii TaxID=2732419 RepID=A0ABR4NBV3_9FUNG
MHTALFLAVQYGHGETVNILIQHGANVKQLDPDDRSPLHWAALCGHLSVVSLLISCEVEIDARDAEGKTPVHCAAYNGHTEVLSFLVKNGAKANIKDNEGVSALHWATCGNHDDCVELLIQLNASPNILDNDLLTPLDYAISVRSHECASVLVERGGQPGEIICDVFAFRIQRAWRRHQRRRHARKASSGGDARQGRRGSLMPRASFSGMQQGRRVSIGGMGAFAMPAAHAGGARRASMAVAGAGRSSRDYSMRGMDMTDTGTGGLTLDSSKSTRSSRSRSLFPSRPSLVKSSASRSRMQLSVQPRHDASITEDDGRFDMRKRLSNVQSMSSFEMEYFQMEAERRRKEEEGR